MSSLGRRCIAVSLFPLLLLLLLLLLLVLASKSPLAGSWERHLHHTPRATP
jgi:hypothetical protein